MFSVSENQFSFLHKLGKVAKHRRSVRLNEGSPGVDLRHGGVQSFGRNTLSRENSTAWGFELYEINVPRAGGWAQPNKVGSEIRSERKLGNDKARETAKPMRNDKRIPLEPFAHAALSA